MFKKQSLAQRKEKFEFVGMFLIKIIKSRKEIIKMNNKKDILELYYIMYSNVVNKIEHKNYEYTDVAGYMNIYFKGLSNGDIRQSQKIYWQEILLRVHFAAVTSLIRAQKWLSGVILGRETKNLLVFCASLRGFLEATVDSYYSLESLPASLALNFKNINSALKGELNQSFVNNELESKLIHFQFAKRGKKGSDASINIAHTNVEYIKSFDLDNIGIKELYSELCELTHPAANSVNCFTEEIVVSEFHSYSVTSTETDNDVISEIISKYWDQINILLKMGISLYCICLKLLTLFDFKNVHSEYINESIFENILNKDSWNKLLEMVEKGEKYLDEHNIEKIIHY